MAWSQPKVDWASSDTVSESDMNRWEGNTLATQFALSGCVGGDSSITLTTGSEIRQNILISVPDGYELVLTRANWLFTDSNIGLRVSTSPSSNVYSSGASTGDTQPATVLSANSSGSPVSTLVYVTLYEISATGTTDIEPLDSWHVNLAVEET